MKISKILIIGSGNVASHLAKAFSQNKNCEILLSARNLAALQTLSTDLQLPTCPLDDLAFADLYLIATSDIAIAEVSSKIKSVDSLVTHTSGSMSVNEIKSPNPKAVFYPLQSFSNQKDLDYSKIPIFIESENSEIFENLKSLAAPIFGEINAMDFGKRKALHLSAVFACNFVNHMFSIAEEIAKSHQISFELLKPLIAETFEKIGNFSPKEVQTGPAVRQDIRVLEAHEKLIQNPEFLKVYQSINQSIIKYHPLKKNDLTPLL